MFDTESNSSFKSIFCSGLIYRAMGEKLQVMAGFLFYTYILNRFPT